MHSPTHNSHTHCQAAHSSRTSQILSKSMPEPAHGRKEKEKEKRGTTKPIRNTLRDTSHSQTVMYLLRY